jgi:uncharacterized protein (TIGR02145 family)
MIPDIYPEVSKYLKVRDISKFERLSKKHVSILYDNKIWKKYVWGEITEEQINKVIGNPLFNLQMEYKYCLNYYIAILENGETWRSRTTGARTIYENNSNNLTTFGYLYNWFAAVDPRGLCPQGWKTPTDSDWEELAVYLGGEKEAANKMKSIGTTYWKNNLRATNESGFSGLPGEVRYYDGKFSTADWSTGTWWASDDYDSPFALYCIIDSFGDGIRSPTVDRIFGASVRCLRD